MGLVEETLEGRWHGEARVATGTYTCDGETAEEAMALVDVKLATTLTSKKLSAWAKQPGGLWQRLGEGLLGPVPVVEVRPATPSLLAEAPYVLEQLDGSTHTYASLWRAKGHADHALKAQGFTVEIDEMGQEWHPAVDEVEELLREKQIAAKAAAQERWQRGRTEYDSLWWTYEPSGPLVTLDSGDTLELDPWADDPFFATTQAQAAIAPERTFVRDGKTFRMALKAHKPVKSAPDIYRYAFVREDVPSLPWLLLQWAEEWKRGGSEVELLPWPPPKPAPAPVPGPSVGPWISCISGWDRWVVGLQGVPVCRVVSGVEDGQYTAIVGADTVGNIPDLQAAKDFCDTTLRNMGYTLQD